jgi:hydrogenase maturation protein HypF
MKITVYGIVQGVGFRPTVYRVARAMGLKGYVLNNGSNVEIHVDRGAEEFLEELKKALPALARIDRAEFEDVQEKLEEFSIMQSTSGRTTPGTSDTCFRSPTAQSAGQGSQ